MSTPTKTTSTGLKIRVIRQSASPIEHTLEDGRSVFVGRSDSCGIQIKGDGIADIHCLIDVDKDQVSIQDWASAAGTKVNGTTIDDKTAIQAGDSVVIGNVTLELVGVPGKSGAQVAKEKAAKAAAETREESVGMESMGYETAERDAITMVADRKPVLRQQTGRLSDTLRGEEFCSTQEQVVDPVDSPDSISSAIDEPNEVAQSHPEDADFNSDADFESGSDDPFAASEFSAEDMDWDPASFDDEPIDAEIVQLLKSEIEDLRIQLAERDEQLATFQGMDGNGTISDTHSSSRDSDFAGNELVERVDELLAELSEHDERVSTLQELLQTAEIQNQAEREERNCLETWVGEIEQRIGARESEWRAEQDALRERLQAASEDRDRFQQQLHAAAKRFGQSTVAEVIPDESLQLLQKQNAALQSALDESQKQCASLTRQIDRLQNEEPESLQELRAELAKEKASVSRMRFQLSKQLQDIETTPATKEHPDREFAFKLQTLREHLREIHEEEKSEREQKSESLFGRISSLWKRVDDEY